MSNPIKTIVENMNVSQLPYDENSIMILVPKRHRKSNINTGDVEKDTKISDLNRQLYYLKKYGISVIPPKRNYIKKDKNLFKTVIDKKSIIINFE